MKILTQNELPDKLDFQIQLLHLSANWSIFGLSEMSKARKLGYPTPDYCALYAIEGDEILSKIEAIRINYEFPTGKKILCGISGVVTRRDKARYGLARNLFEEVHRREKAIGTEFIILCTSRSNKAHELYSSLGYIDVYAPPIAIKKENNVKLTATSNSSALGLRQATIDDASLLHELHSKSAQGRLGFTQRYANYWRIWFGFGFDKPESYQIILSDGKPIGYAKFQDNNYWATSYEIVTLNDKIIEDVLNLIESKVSDGGWLVTGFTFASDNRGLLQRRGYEFLDFPYNTMMAHPLEAKKEEKDLIHFFGIDDPRFVCQQGDFF
jgi:hypothetical protein